jgi:hypothetical protein
VTKLVVERSVPRGVAVDAAAIERAIRLLCDGTSLQVRVPLRIGARALLEATYSVECGVSRGRDGAGLNEVVLLTWQPAARVLLPALNATVLSDAGDDGETVVLRLEGTYQPPGRTAGEWFDDVIGSRIAESSARDFLARIADALARTPGTTPVDVR